MQLIISVAGQSRLSDGEQSLAIECPDQIESLDGLVQDTHYSEWGPAAPAQGDDLIVATCFGGEWGPTGLAPTTPRQASAAREWAEIEGWPLD